jgi:hypothetical protein
LKPGTEAHCGRVNSERADFQIVRFGYSIFEIMFSFVPGSLIPRPQDACWSVGVLELLKPFLSGEIV